MAAKAEGSTSFSTANCTVCLEDLSDSCGRTVVTLRCSHVFHLDCIGSAYNMKGAMECPNCREVENGLWLCFVNESSDTMDEESDYDDDDEEFEEFEEFEMCVSVGVVQSIDAEFTCLPFGMGVPKLS